MNADEIAKILDRANDLLEAGKPADTLRCLAQVERKSLDDEQRIEAVTLRAWALSELGNHDGALQALEPLLDEFPDSARLHAARGVVLSNADELDLAHDALHLAHSLDEDDEVTLANLALVCEKLRDYETALELYDKALNLGADIDWSLQRKAAVQTELADYAGAKSTLKRYLSLAPEDAVQWVTLGILHSDDEEYDAAFDCYAQAENATPESTWLHLNIGVTAVRAERFPDAERALEQLRRLAPHSARTYLLEAFILDEKDEPAAAESAYQSALDTLDDHDVDDVSYVLEMAIDFYARRGRKAACETLLKRAYVANACTVELCEAYREAMGELRDEAAWFSLVVEADYRKGLDEVVDRRSLSSNEPQRFLRNFQVVAGDRDEAIALVIAFTEQMGEQNVRVREFISDEPMEETRTGVYEVERKSLVFIDDDRPEDATSD